MRKTHSQTTLKYSKQIIIIGGKKNLIKITTDLCKIKTAISGAANARTETSHCMSSNTAGKSMFIRTKTFIRFIKCHINYWALLNILLNCLEDSYSLPRCKPSNKDADN